LPWYKSFIISIAIHAVIVAVVAMMPPIQHDPMRLLQPHNDAEAVNLNRYEDRFVAVNAWNEIAQTEAVIGDDGDALPEFAQEDVPVEPVFEGTIQKKAADSEPEIAPTVEKADLEIAEKERVEPREQVKTTHEEPKNHVVVDESASTEAPQKAPDPTPQVAETQESSGQRAAQETSTTGSNAGVEGVGGSAVAEQNGSAPKAGNAGTTASNAGSGAGNSAADEAQLWAAYVRSVASMFKQTKRPYPDMAKRLGHQGTVVLDITLARDGKVMKTSVYASSGSKILDEAALNFAQKASYPPFPEAIAQASKTLRAPIIYSLKKK